MSCGHYTIRQRSYTSCVFLAGNINASSVPHPAVADAVDQTSRATSLPVKADRTSSNFLVYAAFTVA